MLDGKRGGWDGDAFMHGANSSQVDIFIFQAYIWELDQDKRFIFSHKKRGEGGKEKRGLEKWESMRRGGGVS